MIDRREWLRMLGAAAISWGARRVSVDAIGSAETAPKPKKILMFTKSSGYEHSVTKRAAGKLSLAEQIVTDLGRQHRFEVTATKDGRIFSDRALAQHDEFFFFTTGDLTTRGTDGNPPMSLEGKRALLDLIYAGRGFIGTHSAADTFDTAGNRFDPRPQAQLDPYLKMIGAEFLVHDQQQKARLTVTDKDFPGMTAIGDGVEIVEEWYTFRDCQSDLHVLTILETRGMTGPHYQRARFPNTWARLHGRGRIFYTALGHREDVWMSAAFQSLLLGGISWALGNVNAPVAPNITQVTPQANDIPISALAAPGK